MLVWRNTKVTDQYRARKRVEEGTQSTECANCGAEPSEHAKERVYHENGRYSYDYYCGGSDE